MSTLFTRLIQKTVFLNQSPRVFAVAVTLAKIMIACTAIAVLEFEVPDLRWVLVV
jgi:hypothetical protein